MKIGLISLGCPKNLVDSEVILGILQSQGYEITNLAKAADILIVNTCAFIKEATQEAVNTIKEMSEHKDKGNCRALIVTGCLPQRYPTELLERFPQVDGFLGAGEFYRIDEVIREALKGQKIIEIAEPKFLYNDHTPRLRATPPWTAYLKIAEGCDNCCSYCTVPRIRGRYRSRPMESILAEAERLAEEGVKEINLIAQDTTRYGLDLYGKPKIVNLLRKLAQIEKLHWIRLLYCYPARITPELIETVAEEPKICKYFDIPLQHSDNEILSAMHRPGTGEGYLKLIEAIRDKIPEVTLRTTLMVGFPGETERHFLRLLDFVRIAKFDRLGAFKYSQEEGTLAARYPNQVPEEIKSERYEKLMSWQRKISKSRNVKFLGKVIEVLIEGNSQGDKYLIGRTQGDAPEIDGLVYVNSGPAKPGEFVKVKITGHDNYDLYGRIVS